MSDEEDDMNAARRLHAELLAESIRVGLARFADEEALQVHVMLDEDDSAHLATIADALGRIADAMEKK